MPQLPLQQIRILKTEPWTIPVDSHPIGRPPLSYPALQKLRSPDVVASGHPPRHSRCLRVSATSSSRANRETKYNINTTLVALTMQLQQLTQLVANPPPPPISNTPPPPVPSPPASPPPVPTARRMRPKLSCPPDFGGEHYNGRAFLNSCSLYIHLAPEQFHNEEERILWALTFFKSGRAAKWSENVFHQEVDTGVFPI